MCGFGGIVGSERAISYDKLFEIASKVKFRGPDFTGTKVLDSHFQNARERGWAGFFHNRLAILDLESRSNQPFEDERYLLVYNGEIYNYRSLREELRNLGSVFHTRSDTEVLFEVCKRWKEDAIPRLDGMFAFAFLDKIERTLILARDRVGIKPLCYTFRNGALAFASETDSIIRLLSMRPQIDEAAVSSYLLFQSTPTPKSIWRDILKLQPGFYLKVDFDRTGVTSARMHSYWDAYHCAQETTVNQNLESVLAEALRSQLVADVPVGLFLSGGIDSTTLAALIAKYSRDAAVSFFTITFRDPTEHDESSVAQSSLVNLFNGSVVHHSIAIEEKKISDLWSQLYEILDEPFGDHAVLLNWVISKEAAKHATVVLSGDGADEVFGGYDRYRQWQRLRQWSSRWGRMSSLLARYLNLITPKKRWQTRSFDHPIKQYLTLMTPTPEISRHFTTVLAEKFSGQHLNGLTSRPDLPRLIDFKTYLPDCMLYKVDRASMGASIENRVPFLSNDVVAIGLNGVAPQWNGPTKPALKALLGNLLPTYPLHAPKKGFSFPLEQWMRGPWRELFHDIATTSDPEAVTMHKRTYRDLFDRFYKGDSSITYQLWMATNLLLWHTTKRKTLSL